MQRILVAARPTTIVAPGQTPGTPLVSDTFDRADSTTSLGTADTGQAWTVLTGATWGVQTNRAYMGGGGDHNPAIVESGASDVKVSATVYPNTDNPRGGLSFRVVDVSNFFFLRSYATVWQLNVTEAGTTTTIAQSSVSPVGGQAHAVEITCSGSTITCKVDGATIITATSSLFLTATKHGLENANGSFYGATRWDNFKVEALGTQPLVSDSFDRATVTHSLGTADTGQVWTNINAALGIEANQARHSADPGEGAAHLDSGASDVTITCEMLHGGNNGLIFRSLDGNNYLLTRALNDKVEVYRRVAGSYAQVGQTLATFTVGQTYTFKVVASGSTIDVYVDGSLQLTVTDSFQSTLTRHGLWGAGTGVRWDNFKVEAI